MFYVAGDDLSSCSLLYQTRATVHSLPNTRNPNLDSEASVAVQEKLPFFQAKTLNRLIRPVKDWIYAELFQPSSVIHTLTFDTLV